MAKKKEKKEKKAGKRMGKQQLAALLIDFFHAKTQRNAQYEIYLRGVTSHHSSAKDVVRRYSTRLVRRRLYQRNRERQVPHE